MVVEEQAVRVIVNMINIKMIRKSFFENMGYLQYRRRDCQRDSLPSLERLHTGRLLLGASTARKSPLAPL